MSNTPLIFLQAPTLGKTFILSKIIDYVSRPINLDHLRYLYKEKPKFDSSDMCDFIIVYHKYFMDNLDRILEDSPHEQYLSTLYESFLKNIDKELYVIKSNHDRGIMPLPKDKVATLMEQVKSRHFTVLAKYPDVKTRYRSIRDKARRMTNPIVKTAASNFSLLDDTCTVANTCENTVLKIWKMCRNDSRYAMHEFTNSDICSTIKKDHEIFMNALDRIIANDERIAIHDESYQLLLRNIIYRGLEILEENHAFCRMALPEDNIISMIEQVKSRHVTELELEEEFDIKTWYNKVIEKANEVIKSIPVFTPEFRAILLQGESTIKRAKNHISLAKNIPEIVDEIIFNRLYEKIKHYKKYSPYQDYINRQELQLIPQKLTSLKQELNALETKFLMQEDREILSSIITDLDILISNSHEPESKIDINPNDGYLNFQTILQEKNQLCII